MYLAVKGGPYKRLASYRGLAEVRSIDTTRWETMLHAAVAYCPLAVGRCLSRPVRMFMLARRAEYPPEREEGTAD